MYKIKVERSNMAQNANLPGILGAISASFARRERPMTIHVGAEIMLLTPAELRELSPDVALFNFYGESVARGDALADCDTRGGHLSVGYLCENLNGAHP